MLLIVSINEMYIYNGSRQTLRDSESKKLLHNMKNHRLKVSTWRLKNLPNFRLVSTLKVDLRKIKLVSLTTNEGKRRRLAVS